jgi:opacity protein-like surface antigen
LKILNKKTILSALFATVAFSGAANASSVSISNLSMGDYDGKELVIANTFEKLNFEGGLKTYSKEHGYSSNDHYVWSVSASGTMDVQSVDVTLKAGLYYTEDEALMFEELTGEESVGEISKLNDYGTGIIMSVRASKSFYDFTPYVEFGVELESYMSAGLNYQFSPNLSLEVEYTDYVNLEDGDYHDHHSSIGLTYSF